MNKSARGDSFVFSVTGVRTLRLLFTFLISDSYFLVVASRQSGSIDLDSHLLFFPIPAFLPKAKKLGCVFEIRRMGCGLGSYCLLLPIIAVASVYDTCSDLRRARI